MPKKHFHFILSFLAVTSVYADGGGPLKTVPLLRTTALRAIQLRLCENYRTEKEVPACLTAGESLRKILAFSNPLSSNEVLHLAAALDIPQYEAEKISITAIHTDRLSGLLTDSSTISYFQDLGFQYRYFASTFQLWRNSVSLSPSPANALERIAVLFQDLSQAQEHLHWAMAKDLPQESITGLENVLEPMSRDLKVGFVGVEVPAEVLRRFYPTEVSQQVLADLTPRIYHFYSAAYWTYRLRVAGVSASDAALQAFGIHLAYEISDVSGNYWPVGYLPESLPSFQSAQDLASAYWGAAFGNALFEGRPFQGRAGLAETLHTQLRAWMRHFSESTENF